MEDERILTSTKDLADTDVENTLEVGPLGVGQALEHQHKFVDGECECGETDPDYVVVGEGKAYSLDTLTKVTTISRKRLRKDYSFYLI